MFSFAWLTSKSYYMSILYTEVFWSTLSRYKSHTVGRENGRCTKDSNDNSCREAVNLAHSDSCYNHAVWVTIAFPNPVTVFCTIWIILHKFWTSYRHLCPKYHLSLYCIMAAVCRSNINWYFMCYSCMHLILIKRKLLIAVTGRDRPIRITGGIAATLSFISSNILSC